MIEKLKRFNWISFAALLGLIALGTRCIYSAGHAREAAFHGKWLDNLETAIFGLVLYFILASIDYRRFLSRFAWSLYGMSVFLLTVVLLVGTTLYGSRRWLWFFQPSEVSKFCIISLMAAFMGSPWFQNSPLRKSYKGFLIIAGLAGLPALLILAEPDLGTTLTLVPAVIAMMLVAGVWRKGLVTLLIVGALGVTAILGAVYEAERPGQTKERRAEILKYTPLKAHQVKRVKVFLFPEDDLTDSGYNLHQAKIAIGSGGYAGKGWGKGETNRLKYLPAVVSMSDFIFCVYAEERGFAGSMILLALYAALLIPLCWVAVRASDMRGRLLATGFVMLIFAHVYVNIGMSVGLVPITGLPLPMISLGRTFLITALCCLGIVQSVAVHRDDRQS